MVECDRHVQKRDALRHRELELVDLQGRQVHVVDQVIEAAHVCKGSLLDDASAEKLRERKAAAQVSEPDEP